MSYTITCHNDKTFKFDDVHNNAWNTILAFNYYGLKRIPQWFSCVDCGTWSTIKVDILTIKTWKSNPNWKCPHDNQDNSTYSQFELLALAAQKCLLQMRQPLIGINTQTVNALNNKIDDYIIEIVRDMQSKPYPLTKDEFANKFVILTNDGGIKKKIIESSVSHHGLPPKNSTVICHYVGTLPNKNNEKFESSRDCNVPYEFQLGKEQMIKGFEIGIASMKKGEKCILRCASSYAYGENGSPPKIPGNATVDFEVELIDWKYVWEECIVGKKRILTTVNDKDNGKIKNYDCVCIKYEMYYMKDDTECVFSDKKDTFKIIVNDDDRFPNAFHMSLKTMKKGEKSIFKILKGKSFLNEDEIYIDVENGINNKVGIYDDIEEIFYEIFVENVISDSESMSSNAYELIKMGLKYKNEGNELFKVNRYFGALNKYMRSLNFNDWSSDNEEIYKPKRDTLAIAVNNNLALVYMQRKDWSLVIKFSSVALNIQPNNSKALRRRGEAYLEKGDTDLGEKDLKQALRLGKGKNNVHVKDLLNICGLKRKQYAKKQKKLYGGIFEKNSKKQQTVNKINNNRQINTRPKSPIVVDTKIIADIENKLQLLVDKLNDDNLQTISKRHTNKYDSIKQLILNEDNLFDIFGNNIFKNCTNEYLFLKIYNMIMKRAQKEYVSSQLFNAMITLNSLDNYMYWLSCNISRCLKWSRKIKALETSRKTDIAKVKEFINENDKLKNEVQTMQKRFDSLQGQHTDLMLQNNAIKNKYDTIASDNASLTIKYNTSLKYEKQLQNESKGIKNKFHIISKQFDELKKKTKLDKVFMDELQQNNRQLKDELKEQQLICCEMKCMDNMNNELRFCNVELKRAQKQLKNKYNSLASEHETA
eukprot:227472_1